MKSKTSCFNKTIFLKNMTRFWPVWAVYLAYLFFNMTVRMFLNTRNYMNTPAVDHYSATPATNRLMTMLECISGNLEPYVIFFRGTGGCPYHFFLSVHNPKLLYDACASGKTE